MPDIVPDIQHGSIHATDLLGARTSELTTCSMPLPSSLAPGVYIASVADDDSGLRTCRFVLDD